MSGEHPMPTPTTDSSAPGEERRPNENAHAGTCSLSLNGRPSSSQTGAHHGGDPDGATLAMNASAPLLSHTRPSLARLQPPTASHYHGVASSLVPCPRRFPGLASIGVFMGGMALGLALAYGLK